MQNFWAHVKKNCLYVKLIPTPLFGELRRRRKKYRATQRNFEELEGNLKKNKLVGNFQQQVVYI